MKKITILGATGSIGGSALNVYRNFKSKLSVHAVSVNSDVKGLLKIIDECHPKYAVMTDGTACKNYFGDYKANYNGTDIFSSDEGLDKICSDTDTDMVLNAISGQAGLLPSVKVLSQGIDLALANKESMVCGGDILKELAKKNGCKIVPVDSEHSAVFQLLEGKKKANVKRVIITASGGPFRNRDKSTWDQITVEEALAHPTWSMGRKISIDSATMANKGLEVIEAHQLFDMDYDDITVLIHPQSLIHSMIECNDGELYAQIGPKDMSLPIQNALFYSEMQTNQYNRLDLTKGLTLELLPADLTKYRMLQFAYDVGRKGGIWPAYYNNVNEILVAQFLQGQIKFTDIENGMEDALEKFDKRTDIDKQTVSLENIALVQGLR